VSGRVEVAFRAKRPMNYEMFRPYHERLRADPRFDVTLYGKGKGRSDLSVLDAALPARRRRNWVCKFSAPDVLFSADFLLPTHRARLSIQIFHGTSIKNYELNERIHDYGAAFALGPYMIRRYVEKGFFEPGDPRLRHVGFAKTDRLTNGTLDARATREKHGLDPARPTVLYAPSWGAESSLDQYGEALLAALAGWGGNTLVKLHDNAYDPRYARRDWRAFLDGLTGPRFAAPRVWDVIPLMHAADLLITDISSVGFEFLQVDRPLLFMDFPGQLVRWENADLETWGRKTGTLVQQPAALPAAIDRALASPREQSDIRRAACADIYFNVGRATDAGMAELYGLLGLAAPARERRPGATASA
jgi:CDP-glycerol glycerophosphotransferase (TagB/SpsB family)